MKNGTKCARWSRWWLVFSSGRISSMLAPVVPIKLANSAPKSRKSRLFRGVASMSPFRWMPPEVVNNAPSVITKAR